MTPLRELRKICERATRGRWMIYPYKGQPGMGIIANDPHPVMVAMNVMHAPDVEFIMEFHPARVLEILEDYEAMKTALEDCTGGDLASGEGIYKAERARECLASLRLGKEGGTDE